jgi:hypothetical protein
MNKPWHVVKIEKEGVHQNYYIYKNNEPEIVPAEGKKLLRETAYKLVHLLNNLGA